jgi:hypothetical protein
MKTYLHAGQLWLRFESSIGQVTLSGEHLAELIGGPAIDTWVKEQERRLLPQFPKDPAPRIAWSECYPEPVHDTDEYC